jgi:CubicO group peptidase (beta-lactamase class C family)
MPWPAHAGLILQRDIRDGLIAGAGLVVLKDGRRVAEEYYGEAAPGAAANQHTLWPVASISKVYAAAAVMRLVEQGVLTLNMPVHLVVPEFTGDGREKVRLRHLLTHTAGLPYESADMEAHLKAHTSLHDLLKDAIESVPSYEPGTSLRYADYHYLVAAHVAEIAAGRSFVEILRSEVIEGAGLRRTYMPPPHETNDAIALVRGAMAEGTDADMYNSAYGRSLAHPAFGVYASTSDLAAFGSTFMPGGPRFLCEASVHAMTTDQTGGVPGTHPSMQGYAAGVRVPWAIGFALQTAATPGLYSDLASPRTFGHGGATGCALVCDPACGLVVALTTNTHLRTGRERWTRRVQSVLNCAFAANL